MQTETRPYSRLNEHYTFEKFVIGPNNQFAHSAAIAVAESPGRTRFNPLLVYGGVGLGKTHLIQSIGNYVIDTVPGSVIMYMSSDEFHTRFIDSLKDRNAQDFTAQVRGSDVLLIDDVQFFAGKEGTQDVFFHIFNSLYQNGKQIILASDRPPAALKGLEERLISRFQSGLSVDIQPPDLETRIAILNKKAEEGNLSLSGEILYYIAENVSSNIRELEGAVRRLLVFASINHSDITLDLAKSVLKDNINKTEKTKISIDHIIEKTAAFYKIPINNILEKNKRKEVAFCRQVAMYISKSTTNHTLKSIGLNFGGRDHSTVLHAVQLIDELIKNDEQTARDIEYIISSLK
jgi:chromosomal replication initiator protein